MLKGFLLWFLIWFIGVVYFAASKDDDGFEAFNAIMIFYLFIFFIRKIFEAGERIVSRIKGDKIVSDKSIDKLEKLAILKIQGALTNEEFEEQIEKIMKKYKK